MKNIIRPPLGAMASPSAMLTPGSPADCLISIKNQDTGELLFENDIVQEKANQIAEVLNKAPEAERRRMLLKMRGDVRRKRKAVQAEISLKGLQRAGTEKFIEVMRELTHWYKGGLELQKAKGSVAHHLSDEISEGKLIVCLLLAAGAADYGAVVDISGAHSFVIEHNWAAAFKGAQDFEGGEYHFPYPAMIFEFMISGRRVCAVVAERPRDGVTAMGIMVRTSFGWAMHGSAYDRVGDAWVAQTSRAGPEIFPALIQMITEQIRAICISLEADVATTEVVRAPYKLNRSRIARGRAPIMDYHVVSLVRRPRALPDPDAEPGRGSRKALHFRRGHWRKYEDHRTWIKWMLVGDPDLGFVDKHYKL